MAIAESDLILNPDGSVYHLNLRPEHLGEIIIAVGDPERVTQVSRNFDRIDFRISKREFVTHGGTINGKKIIAISSGIGTDNVEILMTELDILANFNLVTRTAQEKRKRLQVIRIGTSGALQPDLEVGSFLASEVAVGLDTLMNFYELQQSSLELEISRQVQSALALSFTPYVVSCAASMKDKFAFDLPSGNTVTCPGFYGPQGRVLGGKLSNPGLLAALMSYKHPETGLFLTNLEMETAGYYAMGRLLGHQLLSVNAIIANRAKGHFAREPEAVVDALIKKILARI